MNKITYSNFNISQKYWYANALMAVVMADGVVHPMEQKFVDQIFQMFEKKPKLLEDLKQILNEKKVPDIPVPPTFSSSKTKAILEDCVAVAIADGFFDDTEQEMIELIGQRLNCSPEEIKEIVDWGKSKLAHIFSLQ